MPVQKILSHKLTSVSYNAERQGSYNIKMYLDKPTVKDSRGL